MLTSQQACGGVARAAKRLTKTDLDVLLRRARADAAFSALVADAGQPGLYAQARRGRVRFVFVYRPPGGGARKRLNLDLYGAITLEQARAIAQERRGEGAKRQDPQIEKKKAAKESTTVKQAAESYLADLLQRAEIGAKRGKRSSWATARRRVQRHVLPALGDRRIRDL
jgi:hypothetical protein